MLSSTDKMVKKIHGLTIKSAADMKKGEFLQTLNIAYRGLITGERFEDLVKLTDKVASLKGLKSKKKKEPEQAPTQG